MHFTICHELDAPLDAVELAVLSPELGPRLASKVAALESVVTVEHALEGGELLRVLRFQASAPLPIFKGYPVTRDAMSWEERSTYRLADHASSWEVTPKAQWRSYFRSRGTYRLERLPDGRTRRRVDGDIEIRLHLLGPLVERLALAEVQRTYDAEADTLRELVSA
ncbi:hypothetical protein SOCEGT47_076830 [Sorangium cellulosum]|uniref:DUF2505 domain-containing protein n=1 Tax=Sorangium cellulosum TaxID=56 RepID=A0A4P2QBL9_SORCE|nr:DUF2505 domain-containing protein [Sorangium cellulosum]AUX27104.1 hypothetical protein SOCEGT47_076830 [Sorangium cellulosum]